MAFAAPATQPATKPAETVQQMEARLAKIKAEAAELEGKISAAKSGTTATLEAVMAKIPESIQYKQGENQVRRNARAEWILKNVCGDGDGRSELSYFTTGTRGTAAIMQGTVVGVHEYEGSITVEVWEKIDVVGSEPLRIQFALPASKYRADSMKWTNGDTLKFSGKLVKLNPDNQECVVVSPNVLEHTPKKEVSKK